MGVFFGLSIFLFLMIIFAVYLLPAIFYLITLRRALSRCSPYARTMSPGLVWLLLIPVFNLVWQFFVVGALSSSLRQEYAARRIPIEPQPGRSLGIAMGVVGICAFLPIPIVSSLLWIAALVLWIMYWVKIAGYSGRLDYALPWAVPPGMLPDGPYYQLPGAYGAPPSPAPYGASPYWTQPGQAPTLPASAVPADRTCAACGAALREDASFCGMCGRRVG